MKKLRARILTIAALLFKCASLNAQNFFGLEVTPFFTIRSGSQYEYVYTNTYSDGATLSLLDWQQNPVLFEGAKAAIRLGRFSLSGQASAAVPGTDAGFVTDYDWKNLELTHDTTLQKICTNYSKSTCTVNADYFLSARALFCLKKTHSFSISPFAELEYTYSHYQADGGILKYGAKDSKTNTYSSYETAEEESMTGTVLSLQRIEYFTWAGLELKWDTFRGTKILFEIAACPYANIQSLDYHALRYTYFLDLMEGFFCGIKASLGLETELTKRLSLCINAQILDTSTIDGNTRVKSYSSKYFSDFISSKKDCGSSFSFFDFSTGFKIILF